MRTYKLNIRNFQSLKSVDLEITGLTVIWGSQSSIGKSAVVRAIDSMLFGNAPRGIVMRGQKHALVMLQWEDHYIKWAKGDTVNGYEIDGVQFDKVGRAAPEEIINLGFYELAMQDLSIKPQIRKQFDKAWPLVLSAPDLGKVVGSLVQTEQVYAAIKTLLADTAKLRGKRGQLETLLGSKRKEAESFVRLDAITDTVARLDYAPIAKLEELLAKINDHRNVRDARILDISRLSKIANISIPDSEQLRKLLAIRALLIKIGSLKQTVARLQKAANINIPDSPVDLFTRSVAVSRLLVLRNKVKILVSANNSLVVPDGVNAYKQCLSIKALIVNLERAKQLARAIDLNLTEFSEFLTKQGFVVCSKCEGQGLIKPISSTGD
jgi:hypothetical protein